MILTDPECTSVSAVCGVYELLYDGDERPSLPYSILSTPLSCVSSCIRPVFFAVCTFSTRLLHSSLLDARAFRVLFAWQHRFTSFCMTETHVYIPRAPSAIHALC